MNKNRVYKHENLELFVDNIENLLSSDIIALDAMILRKFISEKQSQQLMADLQQIISVSPFRHMMTPQGYSMSVAMTNCGSFGWITDKLGYRYTVLDPLNNLAWPAMPNLFLNLAQAAASIAGFQNFHPNSCLINRYEYQSKLSLHQDKDEKNFKEPIVSVSLGVPAIFLFGGFSRADKTQKIQLEHGDVVVWGGVSRLRYHGVMPLKKSYHPLLGECRINLTFRKAD